MSDSNVQSSILERIGNSPLLKLKSIVPENSARILIKLESENPTGSMKDRMALAMIEAAEKDGRLRRGVNGFSALSVILEALLRRCGNFAFATLENRFV